MRKMYVLYLAVLMAFLVYSPVAMSAVPVTSGLVLQLDASDVNTTTRSGVTYVTSWTDQSGNGNNAAQTAEANQPTLVSNITPIGGSAVKFDGTSDYLSIVPNSTFDGGSWTMFAVYACDVLSGGSSGLRVINFGHNDIDPTETVKACNTTYCMLVGGSNASGGVRSGSRNAAATGIFVSSGVPAGYAADTFYTGVVSMDSVSASAVAYLINSAGVVTTGSNDGNSTAVGSGNNLATVGCGVAGLSNSAPGSFLNGWVSEILVYNRVLDSTERASVIAYLGEKHLSNPTPANGGSSYDRLTTLKWTPANGATSQTLYFSTDQNSVTDSAPAALKATLAGDVNSYGVDGLQMSTKYYWKINKVVSGSTIPGYVWSFTVPSYYAVDNFEKYVGTGSSTIPGSLRAAWADGYSLGAGNQLGSNIALVNEVNGVSDTIFDANTHSGYQSMLFAFDNTGNAITFNYPSGPVTYTPAHRYSEAKINLSSLVIGTDWTIQGDWNLNVYFAGKATNNTNSPLYLAVEDATGHVSTPVVYPTSSDIAVAGFHTWVICSGDLATNDVNMANLSKLYIGFGDRNNPQVGGKGVVYIDDLRMYRQPKAATDFNQDCKIDFKDFSIMALDWMQHAGCVN